ncbi:MAG TPA: hypothetical protein VFB06_02700 [Streptosporangiaceae bacterium]|nr:hypothetical protein [Streptosporangiaceae bacterium]
MSKGSAGRLAAGAAAVVILAGTGVAAGAGAAAAAPAAPASKSHTVNYSCKVPILGTKTVPTTLTLSAPAKATAGKTVKLKISFAPSGLPSVTITNVTIKSTLTESGAQKGSVTVKAFLKSANSGTVKATLSGSVKLTKTGKVNITPGKTASFSLTNSILGKATINCTATSKRLPVLGTISVAKAGKARAARLG